MVPEHGRQAHPEVERQLEELGSREVAGAAWRDHGGIVVARDRETAAWVSDELAPEHLEVQTDDDAWYHDRLRNYGSIFVGGSAAEAFADYGAGPNHVLPTGGGARFSGGLSVMTFLKASTWLALDSPEPLIEDTVRMARHEGLEAHARAALGRSRST